jgi:hypothetical protein
MYTYSDARVCNTVYNVAMRGSRSKIKDDSESDRNGDRTIPYLETRALSVRQKRLAIK